MRYAEKERIIKLVDALAKIYSTLSSSPSFGPYLKGAYLNPHLLFLAVTSTLHDLVRLSEYHSIQVPDRHKRAGFLARWLVTHKPIQIKNDGDKPDVDIGVMYVANEVFAIYAAAMHLEIDKGTVPFSEPAFQALIYGLMYRQHDSSALSIIFYLAEQNTTVLGKAKNMASTIKKLNDEIVQIKSPTA